MVSGIWYPTSSPAHVSIVETEAVTVEVSEVGAIAVAAIAAAWLWFTHVAYADSTNSIGKKAADNVTDSAASKRSALMLSLSRKITFSLSN